MFFLRFIALLLQILGTQFTETAVENENCSNVYDTANNLNYNCSTYAIDIFQSYPTLAYWLYRLTLAVPFDAVAQHVVSVNVVVIHLGF